MKYHINPATGVTSRCIAKGAEQGGRDCMFIHGDTPQEAILNMEKLFEDSSLKSLQKADEVTSAQIKDGLTSGELRSLASHVILRKPLKELNASHLIQDITIRSEQLDLDSAKVSSAISLASILHASQTRHARGKFKIVPYIEHPLRNTSRLLRAGVTDENIVIASLLHDTVEDGAQSFVKAFYHNVSKSEPQARELLREYIGRAYDTATLDIVDRVTNAYKSREEAQAKSTEQKHREYKEHVTNGIANHKGAFLVKISDFLDNAGSIPHQIKGVPEEMIPRFQKTALKYKPMIAVFRTALKNLDIDSGNGESDRGTLPLSSYVKGKLNQIEHDLDAILKKR